MIPGYKTWEKQKICISLTTQNAIVLDMLTEYEEADGISVSIAKYYYKPNIDYVHYVSPMYTNELILLPTPEREP